MRSACRRGLAFAWNDELWSVDLASAPARCVTGMRYDLANYTLGDQTQAVRNEGWSADPSAPSPGRDYVMVFEGACDPRNSDPIAARICERFHQPVRYYAFSHIHSQYVADEGGVDSLGPGR